MVIVTRLTADPDFEKNNAFRGATTQSWGLLEGLAARGKRPIEHSDSKALCPTSRVKPRLQRFPHLTRPASPRLRCLQLFTPGISQSMRLPSTQHRPRWQS